MNYDYTNNISYDDVVQYLIESKKYDHAKRVMRMMELIKELEGRLIETHRQDVTVSGIQSVIENA